jgi:hypothetical protein
MAAIVTPYLASAARPPIFVIYRFPANPSPNLK